MNDLIRRRDAVSRMSDLLMMELQGQRLPTWNEVYQAMNDIPSAEPERKKGQWVRNFDGNEWYWYCSNCKEKWYEEDLWMGGNDFPNFCPNCGADMTRSDDE